MKKWRSLKSIADEYADVSERWFRDFLGHHTNPLPARLVRGKWLVNVDEFDAWLLSFPKAGEDVDRLVESIVQEITGEKT